MLSLTYDDADIVDGPAVLFDSITAVEFSNLLSETFGLKVPSTLVFDYPSPSSMANHVHDLLGMHANDKAHMSQANVSAGGLEGAISTQATPTILVPCAAPAGDADNSMHLACLLLASRLPQVDNKCGSICQSGDSISITPFNRWDVEDASRASYRMQIWRQYALGIDNFSLNTTMPEIGSHLHDCSSPYLGCMPAVGAT